MKRKPAEEIRNKEEAVEMNILVVGGGHLGRKIAEDLDAMGHEVAVIEESEEKLEQLSSDFGGVAFLSFPMDISHLKEAGIESCDAVAVTTSDDNLNIAVGQIARNIFGVKQVVSRISDPLREGIFEGFGLRTVCPTNMAGESIVSAIVSPQEEKMVTLGTNTVGFVLCPMTKEWVGMNMTAIESRIGKMVMGLIREDGGLLLHTAEHDAVTATSGDTVVLAKKID